VASSLFVVWLARYAIMVEGVVVRPDQVSLGVLDSATTRAPALREAGCASGSMLSGRARTRLTKPRVGAGSTPAGAAALISPQPASVRSCASPAGPQRNIDAWADRLRGIFTTECLHQLPLIEAAMGRQTQALVLQLDAACRAAARRRLRTLVRLAPPAAWITPTSAMISAIARVSSPESVG